MFTLEELHSIKNGIYGYLDEFKHQYWDLCRNPEYNRERISSVEKRLNYYKALYLKILNTIEEYPND